MNRSKYEETQNEIGKKNNKLISLICLVIFLPESMIGDTNLFFANPEDKICAEVEIMIAEPWARGNKCGWEATLLMLLYGITHLEVKQYVAKVSHHNDISLRMFSNIGFIEISRSNVFEEITLSKMVEELWITWLNKSLGNFEVKICL